MIRTRIAYETPNSHVVEFKGKALPIIVEIDGDALTMRHKGHRRRYRLEISDAMREAITRTAALSEISALTKPDKPGTIAPPTAP